MPNCTMTISQPILGLTLSLIMLVVCPGPGSAQDQDLLAIRFDPRPFSPALCQGTGQNKSIRIQVA